MKWKEKGNREIGKGEKAGKRRPNDPTDLPQVVAHVVRILCQVNSLHSKAAQPLAPVNALHVSQDTVQGWATAACLCT
jgi:hypothetical protein